MQRRALTAAATGVALALSGALSALTTTSAQAEDVVSPLVLDAPNRVVARSYDGYVYSGLGFRMTAKGAPFEIRATRPEAYDGPIAAVWQRGAGAEDDVALPEGSMSSWQGLDHFATVRILREGRRPRVIRTPGCFNGEATKVGPTGPISNPYPWGCPWNPYTLGSVMGVAQDYSASMFPEWGSALRLKPGTYEMVAFITPEWREFFGISEADGRAESTLVVRKGRENWRPTARTAAAAAQRAATADTTDDGLEETTDAPTAESAGALADEFAPDLRSLPAFDISLNEKGTAMRFGATVWNGGAGPMVIEGFREDHDHAARSGPGDHEDHMTAYQYYFDGDGNQTGYEAVGEFAYHAANHNHWHFEDFARYNLYGADANGDRLEDVVVKSTKASFCLVATDAVDLTVPNADMRPEYTDLGSQCGGRGAQSLRQVLANGHGDTYHQFRAGQAFRIGNVPDGTYYIGVEANPADEPGGVNEGRNLQELDYSNNDSFRKVEIFTTKRGVRKVRAAQVGVIEEWSFDGFLRN
ncbi:lysyl oxidase family protein [Nocardioides euryhalodurans]|uniref:Uncharacterized protein n=1 Tax=Nocardioides euryhalodurans TaxID=2518370 RepID=A0A4P7GID5_9ACTN|nr:lysyl oxidase family protein [Nocardioides euryhalodurans]QBR91666.1 hypothetical protein EXE57_04845 [Nocardioides euryhalodurans]